MPSKPPLVITDSVMAHLRACSAQGLTKKQAAKELGYSPVSLNKAIKQAGPKVQEESERMWPHGGHRHGKTKFDNPAVYWLTRSWRVAA